MFDDVGEYTDVKRLGGQIHLGKLADQHLPSGQSCPGAPGGRFGIFHADDLVAAAFGCGQQVTIAAAYLQQAASANSPFGQLIKIKLGGGSFQICDTGAHLFVRCTEEIAFSINAAQHLVGWLWMQKEKIAIGTAHDRGLGNMESISGACAVAYRAVHGLRFLDFAHLMAAKKHAGPQHGE